MIATGRAERLITIAVMAVVLLALTSSGAIAAEGQPGWRPIFDLVTVSYTHLTLPTMQ